MYSPQIEPLLDVLADETALAIFSRVYERPRSAKALAESCDTSLKTIYRRVEELEESYRTAVSLGGETRATDSLVTKAEASFTEHEEATNQSAHRPGTACGNCSEFVPDKNGDGFGACVKVQGYIAVEDWCSLYEHVTDALE
ncbi:MAG: winged helix-turn-helix domain-containing protein [Halobacteriaceae archaeon]